MKNAPERNQETASWERPPSALRVMVGRFMSLIREVMSLAYHASEHHDEHQESRQATNNNDEALIRELARVFWDREKAMTLVISARLPPQCMPEFKSPRVFWTLVVSEVDNGALEEGVRAIAVAAAERYPGNRVFKHHR